MFLTFSLCVCVCVCACVRAYVCVLHVHSDDGVAVVGS